VAHPKPGDLAGPGSPDDFLKMPADPPLDANPTGQLTAFLRGRQIGATPLVSRTPLPSQDQWLADPGLLDPWASAQVYFYYAGVARPSHWPAANSEIGDGSLLALQYWFFYPYNYYPTAATPDLMNDAPIAGDVVNTDLHQGDWEHVTVLVDPGTGKPRWLYMAHHSDEGRYFRWDSSALSFSDRAHLHPIVQAAYGGHPTYEPRCGARQRFAHGLRGAVSDWVVCGSGRFAFGASTTPLVDIAAAPWACWKGHFGFATKTEVGTAKLNEGSIQRALDSNVLVAGPRSPLWQAENGHLRSDYSKQAGDTGICDHAGGAAGQEQAAAASGLVHRLEAAWRKAPVTSGP
jgi:hypothetical protein